MGVSAAELISMNDFQAKTIGRFRRFFIGLGVLYRDTRAQA